MSDVRAMFSNHARFENVAQRLIDILKKKKRSKKMTHFWGFR